MRLGSVLFLALAMHVIMAEEIDEEKFQFDVRKQPVLEKEKELRAETVRIYDITSQMEKDIKQATALPPFFQLPQQLPLLPLVSNNEVVPTIQNTGDTKMPVNAKEITQNQTDKNIGITKQEGDKTKQVVTQASQSENKTEVKAPWTQKIDILPIYNSSSTTTSTMKQESGIKTIIDNNQNINSSSPGFQPPGNPSSLPSFVPSVVSSTETQPTVSFISATQPSTPKPSSPLQNNKNLLKNIPQKKPSFQSLNQFDNIITQLSPNKDSPILNESKDHPEIIFPQTNPKQEQSSYLITIILFAVIILTVGTIFGVGRVVMRRRKTEGVRFTDSSAIREDIQTPKLSKAAPYNQTQNNFTDMVQEYDVSHSD